LAEKEALKCGTWEGMRDRTEKIYIALLVPLSVCMILNSWNL